MFTICESLLLCVEWILGPDPLLNISGLAASGGWEFESF